MNYYSKHRIKTTTHSHCDVSAACCVNTVTLNTFRIRRKISEFIGYPQCCSNEVFFVFVFARFPSYFWCTVHFCSNANTFYLVDLPFPGYFRFRSSYCVTHHGAISFSYWNTIYGTLCWAIHANSYSFTKHRTFRQPISCANLGSIIISNCFAISCSNRCPHYSSIDGSNLRPLYIPHWISYYISHSITNVATNGITYCCTFACPNDDSFSCTIGNSNGSSNFCSKRFPELWSNSRTQSYPNYNSNGLPNVFSNLRSYYSANSRS